MSKSKKQEKKAKASKQQKGIAKVERVAISPARFEEMRDALEARVKPSRYLHSLGVSETALKLAQIYGVDWNAAAVAGLLHDWDKSLSGAELKRKAKKLKLADKQTREHATGVLHSWTAAATLREQFPDLSDEVLHAIGNHTCGAVDMTDLDMVVFVADIIEPSRSFPDIAALREAVGKVSLEELFYRTYKANLMYLLSADMVVASPSLDVYNSLVVRRKKRAKQEAEALATADPNEQVALAQQAAAQRQEQRNLGEPQAAHRAIQIDIQ